MKKLIIFLLIMVIPISIQADKYLNIGGIRYQLIYSNRTATVLPSSERYFGNIVIPETVSCYDEAGILVGYTVTAIERGAFIGCTDLKSISIPGTVKEIGYQAFVGCASLSTVSIGEGVEEIGESAFEECKHLKSISIPGTVKEIGYKAFAGCASLSTVSIGEGVEEIGESAFEDCKWIVNINIPSSITTIGGGAFLRCENMTGYFDLQCKTIGNSAFYGSGITHLRLAPEVTTIGTSAFSHCRKLKKIEFYNSEITETMFEGCTSLEEVLINYVTHIGKKAFYNCSLLTNIKLPESVKTIESEAFLDCSSLSSVDLDDNLTTIGKAAFQGCTNLGMISIPDRVTSLGSDIFKNCSKLTSITIGAKVDRLNRTMFEGCVALESLTISDGNSPIELDEPKLLDEIPLNYFYMGRNFKEGSKLWQKRLEKLEIGDLVTTLGYEAFFNCTNLKTIIIGSGVEIFNDPFPSCPNISEISISNNNKFFDSRDQCNAVIKKQTNELVYGCQNTTIPKSVVKIGNAAFYACSNLTSINIPDGITEIGYAAFSDCTRLSSIIFPNSISSIGKSAFSGCEQLESVIMSNKVSSIGEHAFMNCSKLNSIVIPNTIIEIGEKCFSGCNSLESVHIDTETCDDWFARLPSIKRVTLGENVKVIKTSAFVLCSGLESIAIPDGVNEICSSAFKGCSSMTNLSLGKNVSEIGYKAFANCTSLTDVYSYASKPVDGIFSAIFDGSNIDNAILHVPYGSVNEYKQTRPWKDFKEIVAITDGVQLYNLSYFVDGVLYKTYDLEAGTPITPEPAPTKEGYTFSGWSEIPAIMPAKDVTVTGTFTINKYKLIYMVDGAVYKTVSYDYGATITPESAPTKEGYTFSGWSEIPTIMPAKDVTVTGSFTLVNNDDLKYDYLNSSQTAIVVGIKEGFSGNLVIPEFVEKDGKTYKVVTIANGAFKDCVGLSTVVIPNSVTAIGQNAFSGCSTLSFVTIPNSVTYIGGSAFYGCISLKLMILPEKLSKIEFNTFKGCSGLTSISLPESLTSIGTDAFNGCISLSSVTIPDAVTEIGTCAFYGCTGLTKVTVGKGVKTIYTGAFASCQNLKDFYCYAEAVPAIVQMHYDNHNHVFDNSPISDAKLYVPQTSIANYKTKWPWSLFKQVLSLGGEFSYPEFIYEIGVDGGWMNSHPLRRKGDTGIYIGYYYLMGEFKFREHESDWDGTQWGIGSEEGKIAQGGSAQNINAKEGFYQIEVNLDEMTYRLTQIMTIGIAGSHNGWASNSEMVYDNENGVWLSGLITLSEAETEFKFCANNDWDINWGGSFDNLTRDAGSLKLTKGFYNLELSLSYEGNNKLQVDLLHLITFYVDGEQYFSFALKPGDKIPAVHAPQKEGYTFSGWNGLPEVMPDHDVTVTGTFTINKYKLTYMVDGAEYKSYNVEYGAKITPEAEPTKEGYTFSGWSSIPETMPAKDVVVTGTFTNGAYKLTYMVDGAVYKTVTYNYGDAITPEAEPTKEGYTFSGWSTIPATMPAKDVTVTGTFTINKYKLTFMVGENVYETRTLEYGSTIIVPEMPELTGYTFSWGEVPATMPARDLTIVGEYQPNLYNVTYLIDGQFFTIHKVAYGSTITPPEAPERAGSTFTWGEYPKTMPAHDITIEGTYTVGINLVQGNQDNQNTEIYTVGGKKVNKMQKGVNIIRRGNKVVKVAR